MLKLWGAAITVMAFYAMGVKVAEERRRRLEFIEKMIVSLSDFKEAVTFFALPIPKALERSGIEKHKSLMDKLSDGDKKDFALFLKGIRSETAEGQLSNIAAYEKKLLSEEVEERLKYKKEAKLVKGGFLLFGLLITVLLM
ncbi:MAG: hypothetical protein IJD97_03240 [Clostridia bacterium]|nr:hypothetical protein [Clostridia bacterium]